MDNSPITIDQIFEDAMQHKFDVIEPQFDYIKEREWSEGDFIVLEAAMTMMASGYLDLKFDVNSAVKYLRVAFEACKNSTYHPGEELRGMLLFLKLSLNSTDQEIEAAMENYVERHRKFLKGYDDK